MHVREYIVAGVVGDSTRRRGVFVGVGAVVAGLVAVGVPGGLVDSYIWVFGGFGVVIPLVGGLRAYGVLSSFVATAPYVGVLGTSAFVASGGPLYPFRLVGLWLGVTAVVVLAAYVLGVGIRKTLPTLSESVTT